MTLDDDEKVALLLLFLGKIKNFGDIEGVANEAVYMANRAIKAQNDPSWWEIGGKPHFNKRMARLRSKMKK